MKALQRKLLLTGTATALLAVDSVRGEFSIGDVVGTSLVLLLIYLLPERLKKNKN
jgi:hypothetical protein